LQSDKPTRDEVTGEAVVQAENASTVATMDEPRALPSTPAQLPQWRHTLRHVRHVPSAPVVPASLPVTLIPAPVRVADVIVPPEPVVVQAVESVPEPVIERSVTVPPRLVIPVDQRTPGVAVERSVPPRSWLGAVWQTSVRVVRWVVVAGFVWLIAMVGLIAAFRYVDPPGSALMAMQRIGGQEIEHTWVPLEQVSDSVRRAVMVAEDGKFCSHRGFDFGEIRAAMRAGDGFGRGASTITQQVAKNMFLWPGKSYVRKALEVPLTVAIEAMWSKPRILEVYLNIAEWGPGIFGIEAAAQSYFGRPATEVSEKQAALLAVALPNPIKRDVSDPSTAVLRRAGTIQARMRVTGGLGCGLSRVSN
jgi:monofunctional biosynthetic peptidoglycan transglycosylase